MQTHIYNSALQKLVTLNYNISDFKNNPAKFYPEWKSYMIATETLYRHPKLENGQLIEKTRLELVQEGIESLAEGEIIQANEIISIPKPNGVKIEWTGSEWIETATEEKIEEHNFNNAVTFYNSELEFANKATTELACEIITQEMFDEVKDYMRAIDPYVAKAKMSTLEQVERPSIFDRYN